MAEKSLITIELTKEQQLDVLAATGLLVRTLEVDAEALEEAGVLPASIPLPKWLTESMTSR